MTAQLSPEALATIEKVKKLLALAGNNSNEGEAQSATAKAMDLLAKHNLDMKMVGKTATGRQGERKDNKTSGGLYGWQRDLWQAVCELNFCMYWSIKGLKKGDKYEHRVLGSPANVVGAEVMADYLQGTVERLAKAWAKANYHKSPFVREAIAYREGMTERLCSRLRKLRQERVAEDERKKREEDARSKHPGAASTANALVLMDVIHSEQDYNTDYMYGLEPGTTARERAEREAEYDKYRQQAADDRAKEKLWREENPELAAEKDRLAEEAWQKIVADNAKRDAKNAKRRRGSGERYRQETPRESRQRLHSFGEGYRKADDVSLSRQVDKNNTKALS